MNIETRVGAFVIIGIALFAVGILMLGDIEFKQRYRLHVYFQSAEGLPDKGPVKVAGVEVGKVDKIELRNGRAHVVIRLDENVQVHKDAKASVAITGVIGSKYLDLSLGSPDAPVLREGDTVEGTPSLTFDDLLKKLQDFTSDDPETGSPGKNLKATLSNLRQITDSLNAAIGQQQDDMVEIVANIRGLTAHARNVARDLNEVTSERKEDMKVALGKIRSISERMDSLLETIQKGDGTLGKLVTDKEMGENLKEAVASVKKAAQDAEKVLSRITTVDVYWDYRQRYDFEDDTFRADAGVRIVPREGKYYYIGGNNLGGREDRKIPGNDIEKKNTITAVMGKDFGPLTLYAGVVRSSGGGGVKFRPLPKSSSWNRRVELEAEAFNFPRNEDIQGHHYDTPMYNAGLRVLAQKPWLWIGGQVEDIADRQNFNANVNVTFKDEDIGYILGLLGLAGR